MDRSTQLSSAPTSHPAYPCLNGKPFWDRDQQKKYVPFQGPPARLVRLCASVIAVQYASTDELRPELTLIMGILSSITEMWQIVDPGVILLAYPGTASAT